MALIVSVAACRERYDVERDTVLKQHLAQMRAAIAAYRKDHGQYPPTLNDLVPNYIRKVPADPLTMAQDWRVTTEETVQPSSDFQTSTTPASQTVVIDVHSAAPGADRNGVLYSNY